MKKLGLVIALALGFASAGASAEVIATYDLHKASGTTTPVESTATGFTATALTRSAALTGSAFDQHFYFNGWDTTLNTAKYLTLTIGHAGSYQLGLMTFSVESTDTPSSTVYVRSSKDNFAANVDSFTWASQSTDVTNGDFDFSGLGNLAGSTELRFYFTAANSSIFNGFANHQVGGAGGGAPDVGRDIAINGAAVIPEPSVFGLLGLGLAGLVVARRKKAA